jgi:hypothetical protein
MGRWSRLIPALAVVLLFAAACGEQGTDTPLAPAAPVFDGGYTAGGNHADSTTNNDDGGTPTDSSVAGGYTAGGN